MTLAQTEYRLLSGRSSVQLRPGAPKTHGLSNIEGPCLIIGTHGRYQIVEVRERGRPSLRYVRA